MKLVKFVLGYGLRSRYVFMPQIPQRLGEWINKVIEDSDGGTCPSRLSCGGSLTRQSHKIDLGDGQQTPHSSYYCEYCNSSFLKVGDMYFGSNGFNV